MGVIRCTSGPGISVRNCFPEPNDSHLLRAYWTSAALFLRYSAQRRARHSGQCKILKLQPFRSVLDPIRGQCCFLSCAQIGKIQEVTEQRILSTLWRLIEITFVLDKQSPRTVRTCHSVGTTRCCEAGTNSSGHKRLPTLWKIHLGFLPRKRVHWQWFFFWR